MESAADILWRTAQALAPQGRLPPLFFVTDPERAPDPVSVALRLPAGAGVIYRSFGAADAIPVAQTLSRIARARGLTLLIGLDAELAEVSEAHGLHLPDRAVGDGPALRRHRPDWILTGAAHSEGAVKACADAGLDAALLSPVFPSASRSAGQSLGIARFSAFARAAALPVYALGGVNAATAPGLVGSGAAGIAAVEGLL